MKLAIVAALLLAIIFKLGSIQRELHAIHYQAVLANCLTQAADGVVCRAARPRT